MLKLNGNFININDRFKSKKSILLSHLNNHVRSHKLLILKHYYLLIKLKDECGVQLIATVLRHISAIQQKERMDSFKTKNHKLARLIQVKTPMSSYKVPIINLSDYELSQVERKQLQLGLEYRFVNKNRDLKKNLAANLETLASQASSFVDHTKLEDFHEFLRAYADIFTKNIYATKDYTYKNLKNLIENKDLVVLSGDKDSCVVILKRGDYDKKLQGMIDEGITNGTYAPTAETILNDLKKFETRF